MRRWIAQLLIVGLALVPVGLYASTVTNQICSGAGVSTDPHSTDCTNTALNGSVGHITSTLLTVAGAIAVIIIIIGGISYVTSTGDSSRIKLAKDTILYAIIGLVVITIAYAVVHFVIGSIK